MFLTHALGLQTAIIVLLIGFNLYLSGWKKISYLFVALILFNYETPYLIFAAAPLLVRRSKYELRRHWAESDSPVVDRYSEKPVYPYVIYPQGHAGVSYLAK